jgi:RNA polymerase primary sigma factor
LAVAHTPDDAQQYRKILQGDTKARDRMVEKHLGLVKKNVVYYARRNPEIPLDDLLQEGHIGLVMALNKFDVDKGYRFSTYASFWIKQRIQRFVVFSHPKSATAKRKDIEDFINGRMSEELKPLYSNRCGSYSPIDSPVSRSGESGLDSNKASSIAEMAYDACQMEVSELVEDKDEWRHMRSVMMDVLDLRELTIIGMRFGVMGCTQKKIADIADELDITIASLRSIEAVAMKKIRDELGVES